MSYREVLLVPVKDLAEVIQVIRLGLKFMKDNKLPISDPVYVSLTYWCDAEEIFLKEEELKIEEKQQ